MYAYIHTYIHTYLVVFSLHTVLVRDTTKNHRKIQSRVKKPRLFIFIREDFKKSSLRDCSVQSRHQGENKNFRLRKYEKYSVLRRTVAERNKKLPPPPPKPQRLQSPNLFPGRVFLPNKMFHILSPSMSVTIQNRSRFFPRKNCIVSIFVCSFEPSVETK